MAKQPIFTHEELIAMWHVMPEENASVAQKSALEKLDQYAREYREADAAQARSESDEYHRFMSRAGAFRR